MGVSIHFRHDEVSQIASQTIEDGVFGEVNELILSIVICDFNIE